MQNNKYPEVFKIEMVKRYLNGEKQKDICEEQGIYKSTFWGWTQKYTHKILEMWKVQEKDIEETEEFVDIRRASEKVINSSIVKQSKDIVRIFINGYCVLCNIDNLERVMKVINNG